VCSWLLARGVEVHGVFRVAEWFEQEQIDAAPVRELERNGLRVEIVRERPGRRRSIGVQLLEDAHQAAASAAAVADRRMPLARLDATLSLDLGWALALDALHAPAVAILGDPLRGRLRVPSGARPWSRRELDRHVRLLSLSRTSKALAVRLAGYDGSRRVLGSLSPAEAAALTREGLPVRHFRWFTPDPAPEPWQPRRDPLRLLHVGALATTATRAMFQEWDRAVLPAIAELPFEVEIHLVGRGSLPEFRSLPPNLRVLARGHVDDLHGEFAQAAAFLSPMRYPVGVRTRVITALSHGVPVIADPSASTGLPELTGGADILWARRRGDYAAALRLVHDDVERSELVAAAARRAWERWYDPAQNLPALVQPLHIG
jgi:glycosyltransferase involved in cell wall biosynthesis